MSELKIVGHPEIHAIVVPEDAQNLSVDYYPDAVLVHYDSASEGGTYLDFAFDGTAWDGVRGLADGTVEFANADGSFSSFKAIGQDDMPVNPDDYDVAGEPTIYDASTIVAPFVPLTLDLGVLSVGHDLLMA